MLPHPVRGQVSLHSVRYKASASDGRGDTGMNSSGILRGTYGIIPGLKSRALFQQHRPKADMGRPRICCVDVSRTVRVAADRKNDLASEASRTPIEAHFAL